MSSWSPGRLARAFFRAPRWFYDHGLGFRPA